jgi:hypothetical protein
VRLGLDHESEDGAQRSPPAREPGATQLSLKL